VVSAVGRRSGGIRREGRAAAATTLVRTPAAQDPRGETADVTSTPDQRGREAMTSWGCRDRGARARVGSQADGPAAGPRGRLVAERVAGRRGSPGLGTGWGQDVGVEVTETLLPGVGIRYEFMTAAGERLGVVTRRDGRVTIVTYEAADPDVGSEVTTLTASEPRRWPNSSEPPGSWRGSRT